MKMTPQIDFKLTTAITTPKGDHIFSEGIILRKVSRFVLNSNEDGIVPLPVFYDVKTGKILLDSIPKDIREDYKDIGFSLDNSK